MHRNRAFVDVGVRTFVMQKGIAVIHHSLAGRDGGRKERSRLNPRWSRSIDRPPNAASSAANGGRVVSGRGTDVSVVALAPRPGCDRCHSRGWIQRFSEVMVWGLW
ncbi:unnamed protein product [Gadus morhua 'NCC']